ncbi:MAG: AhpC/TSA family protein [Alistipes sp.]|nr:AhpC/TSA family protein [Alistipes sp.]MBQ5922809.1 AhpC/TSA family protein [Alistipes sp.]
MKTFFLTLAMAIACVSANTVQAQALPENATDIAPMVVGEVVPDVTLTSAEGQTVTLYSLTKEKPAVLVFYRGEWCFNCTNNFRDEFVPNLAEIEKMGYNVICVSPDAAVGLKKTSEESTMPLKHFYGDPKGNLAKAMGVAFLATGRAVDFIKKSPAGNLNTDPYLPAPAFYVLDTNNEVKFADVRPNAISAAKRIGWNFYGPILKSLKLYDL